MTYARPALSSPPHTPPIPPGLTCLTHLAQVGLCSTGHLPHSPRDDLPILPSSLAPLLRNPYDWALAMHRNCWCRMAGKKEQVQSLLGRAGRTEERSR